MVNKDRLTGHAERNWGEGGKLTRKYLPVFAWALLGPVYTVPDYFPYRISIPFIVATIQID